MRFLASLLALFGLIATSAMAQTAPAPTPAADPENIWVLDLSTGGRVTIQLRPDKAPKHVERIKTLTRGGFYNGLTFHRVIPGFMAQGGDPTGTGQGGSSLPDLEAEFNDMLHARGVVSMARTSQPNTANSQFFIVLMPTFRLDETYTAFGRVLSGMQYVDAIAPGEPPAQPSTIVRAWIQADGEPVGVPTPSPELRAQPVAPAATPVPPPVTSIIDTPAPAEAPAADETPEAAQQPE